MTAAQICSSTFTEVKKKKPGKQERKLARYFTARFTILTPPQTSDAEDMIYWVYRKVFQNAVIPQLPTGND